MARLEGTRLGAYEIIERIGSGGMAEVYRAKQRTAFDREVAIKVIRKGYADDEDFRARFLREARLISQLSHLNILPLIEYGESGENGEILFLVMPYIAGGTLRDRIKKQRGPLPLRETVRIFTQLCEAIDHAHQHGVVHRDLKPSNVLLQDGRNVLLADFGIALDTGDARLTSTGMGLGTAEYMAPEQAKGNADRRSDVYSLGVVLFVMLTGQAPYSGSTPFDVLLKHATEPLPPMRTLNPDAPAPFEAVVKTAMAKLPADRFQSAQAMQNAFEQAVVDIGPQGLAAMQWSGSVQAVRLPPGNTPGGRNPASGPSAPVSGPSSPVSGPSTPGSGPATPSGPSVSSPGSGSYSAPPQPTTPAPVPSASAGIAGIEDLPTLRKALTDSQGSLPTVRPAPRVTDPELPTFISGEPATSATHLEATHLAPANPIQPAVSNAPFPTPLPVSGQMPLPAPAPGAPPYPLSAPVSAAITPPPATPAPPPEKKRSKALIAALAALVVVLIGTSTLAALYVLNKTKSGPETITTPTATTSIPSGPPTLLTGTACTQAASHPAQPTANPVAYFGVGPINQGQAAPAFIAIHNDGSPYYTDQQGGGIFSLSPALNHNTTTTLTDLNQPSGIAISLAAPYYIYFLQQGQDSKGKPVEQLMRFTKDNKLPLQIASLTEPDTPTAAEPALALNPTNNALLLPNPWQNTVQCFNPTSGKMQPLATGLSDPVAAVVDPFGNVYIAEASANKLLSFAPGGGAPRWTQDVAGPQDLVFDKDGYLLATLAGSGPGQGEVVRIDPASGKVLTTLASHLQQPRGIALDTSQYNTGTVYFIDQGANQIYAMCYAHLGGTSLLCL